MSSDYALCCQHWGTEQAAGINQLAGVPRLTMSLVSLLAGTHHSIVPTASIDASMPAADRCGCRRFSVLILR